MFCTGCGNKLNETDKFCKVCGTKNIYYNDEAVSYAPPAAAVSSAQPDTLTLVSKEADSAEISSGRQEDKQDWSGRQETAVIQPEVVILPVEQMGQQTVPSDNLPQMDGGKVVITKPADQVKKVKKPLKDASTGLKVGSVFLSILAFLMTVIFVFSLFAKITFSQKTLEASIQKIDYTNMALGDIMADRDVDIDVAEGDTTIDVVYEALTEQGRVKVTRGDVEEIFEETSFTNYISEKLSEYARYAVTGAEPDEITPREIIRQVEANKDTIEEIADLTITDEDLDKLENYLEDDGFLDSISPAKIDETLKENHATAVRNFFSDTVLWVILVFSLLILIGDLVLISYLHRRVKAPLSYIGIPVLSGGLLFMIGMLVLNIVKASMFKSISAIYKSIKPFLSSILGRGILIGAITAFLGLLMVVGYILIKKNENRDKSLIKTVE